MERGDEDLPIQHHQQPPKKQPRVGIFSLYDGKKISKAITTFHLCINKQRRPCLTWIQSSAVTTIFGDLDRQASSKGKKCPSTSLCWASPLGTGRAADTPPLELFSSSWSSARISSGGWEAKLKHWQLYLSINLFSLKKQNLTYCLVHTTSPFCKMLISHQTLHIFLTTYYNQLN